MWQSPLSQNKPLMCCHVENSFMKILSNRIMTHGQYLYKRTLHYEVFHVAHMGCSSYASLINIIKHQIVA